MKLLRLPLLFLTLFLVLAGMVMKPAQPNILLILTDDQGWGDFSGNGNPILKTPHIDRLAREGVRFDKFYVSPVCSPTRASLLTGRYHIRTGTSGVSQGKETMRATEVTLAEALQQAGYRTGAFGKWHNGEHYPEDPNGQGFDHFFGFLGGYFNFYFDPELNRNGEQVKTKGYITDILTDSAMSFMKESRQQPFFCYLPYNAPHSPFQVPDKYFKNYQHKGLDTKDASIYAMCESIDDNVGRLMAFLETEKLAANTIVVFMTDNGPATARYNGNLKGKKSSMDEGGTRVPLYIRWPGKLKAGLQVSRLSAHIDVFPTLLELCGLSLPKGPALDGKSLVPLLENAQAAWPDRMLFTNVGNEVPSAVRTETHRLVRGKEGQVALYDISKDPFQQQDIAKQNPALVQQLTAAYTKWYQEAAKGTKKSAPIAVGYDQATTVILPATEARFTGKIHYKGKKGYSHDWLTGWQSVEDTISWKIKAVKPGRYQVSMRYTSCPAQNIGTSIQVQVLDKAITTTISQPFDPEAYQIPNRVPPTAGVEEKPFTTVDFQETIFIPAGAHTLLLQASKIPGSEVADMKSIELTKVE